MDIGILCFKFNYSRPTTVEDIEDCKVGPFSETLYCPLCMQAKFIILVSDFILLEMHSTT